MDFPVTGADIVKVGIGPGSVCTTRKKTGVGYPQVSFNSEHDEVCTSAKGLDDVTQINFRAPGKDPRCPVRVSRGTMAQISVQSYGKKYVRVHGELMNGPNRLFVPIHLGAVKISSILSPVYLESSFELCPASRGQNAVKG